MSYLEQKLAQSKYMLAVLIKTTFLKVLIVILSFWKKFSFNVFNFWLIFILRAYGKYEQGKEGTNLRKISYLDI